MMLMKNQQSAELTEPGVGALKLGHQHGEALTDFRQLGFQFGSVALPVGV
jgi:hypothetical protein